jgi:hypothetical protein
MTRRSAQPRPLNASRKKRIAGAGAGVEVQDINKLLKMHRQMADMMKKMGKMGSALLSVSKRKKPRRPPPLKLKKPKPLLQPLRLKKKPLLKRPPLKKRSPNRTFFSRHLINPAVETRRGFSHLESAHSTPV